MPSPLRILGRDRLLPTSVSVAVLPRLHCVPEWALSLLRSMALAASRNQISTRVPTSKTRSVGRWKEVATSDAFRTIKE